MKSWIVSSKWIIATLLLVFPFYSAFADGQTIPLIVAKSSGNAVSYSLSIKILAIMTVLTVLPAVLITTSAFARIIIVLAILRQAIGIPNVPSNQIIIGLSLIMTLFVMAPILQKINDVSVQPYMQGKVDEQKAFESAIGFVKGFMMKQTRKTDLKVFMELSKMKAEANDSYPLLVLMPAFITSELKTAFEIGFLIFLPFLIIDLVISSVLMSMGMMMLSPMVISLPFKILFFVLVDGWSLVIASLVTSFRF
ncbi:MAG: flagellar type III secretion system pore protein FliP [Gammaproteobacteria bacterium]|nr:flagellar type III secretion system pore protein FliP [Gammaproteobacteria bacterium]